MLLRVNSIITFMEAKIWQNVQSVERKFNLRNLGKWRVDQISKAKEQS